MQQTRDKRNKQYYTRREVMLVKSIVGIVVVVLFIMYHLAKDIFDF